MLQFYNKIFDISSISKTDIFICALGYEKRSFSLFEKVKNIIKHQNIMVLYFDDYYKFNHVNSALNNLLSEKDILCMCHSYCDEDEVHQEIKEFVKHKNGNIHIDYSSMPRKWYCKLPVLLHETCRERAEIYFWYSVGNYVYSYEAYPSAGIEGYSVIGKTSLRINRKRMHIIGLSYDAIRTKALISILDPDSYITCNAYNSERNEIGKNVKRLNAQVIEQGIAEISLLIDDFSFMIAKLCEIANEYLPLGDVILVPDGPKPLIFAMSLIPQILNKEGITCLHVSRNTGSFEAVNVEASDLVYGFLVR